MLFRSSNATVEIPYEGNQAFVTAAGVFADTNSNGEYDDGVDAALSDVETWLTDGPRVIQFDVKPGSPIDLSGFTSNDNIEISQSAFNAMFSTNWSNPAAVATSNAGATITWNGYVPSSHIVVYKTGDDKLYYDVDGWGFGPDPRSEERRVGKECRL